MTLNGIPITAQPQLDTSSSIKVYLIDGLLSSPPTKIDHLMDVLAANVDEYHMLIHAIHITGLTSFVKVLVDGNSIYLNINQNHMIYYHQVMIIRAYAIYVYYSVTMINGAHILHPDMVAPNGVVHGIHHVLLMS